MEGNRYNNIEIKNIIKDIIKSLKEEELKELYENFFDNKNVLVNSKNSKEYNNKKVDLIIKGIKNIKGIREFKKDKDFFHTKNQILNILHKNNRIMNLYFLYYNLDQNYDIKNMKKFLYFFVDENISSFLLLEEFIKKEIDREYTNIFKIIIIIISLIIIGSFLIAYLFYSFLGKFLS